MKAPTEEGAEVCRNFLEGHREMMETKSHRSGDFELIKYFSSEGPATLMKEKVNWNGMKADTPKRQEELYL